MIRFCLFVIFTLYLTNESVALEDSKCRKMMSEANTQLGAKLLLAWCLKEESTIFSRSKEFKCAQKAAKAKNELGAKVTFIDCVGPNWKAN